MSEQNKFSKVQRLAHAFERQANTHRRIIGQIMKMDGELQIVADLEFAGSLAVSAQNLMEEAARISEGPRRDEVEAEAEANLVEALKLRNEVIAGAYEGEITRLLAELTDGEIPDSYVVKRAAAGQEGIRPVVVLQLLLDATNILKEAVQTTKFAKRVAVIQEQLDGLATRGFLLDFWATWGEEEGSVGQALSLISEAVAAANVDDAWAKIKSAGDMAWFLLRWEIAEGRDLVKKLTDSGFERGLENARSKRVPNLGEIEAQVKLANSYLPGKGDRVEVNESLNVFVAAEAIQKVETLLQDGFDAERVETYRSEATLAEAKAKRLSSKAWRNNVFMMISLCDFLRGASLGDELAVPALQILEKSGLLRFKNLADDFGIAGLVQVATEIQKATEAAEGTVELTKPTDFVKNGSLRVAAVLAKFAHFEAKRALENEELQRRGHEEISGREAAKKAFSKGTSNGNGHKPTITKEAIQAAIEEDEGKEKAFEAAGKKNGKPKRARKVARPAESTADFLAAARNHTAEVEGSGGDEEHPDGNGDPDADDTVAEVTPTNGTNGHNPHGEEELPATAFGTAYAASIAPAQEVKLGEAA
jgi:hypothetical protein